MSKTNDIIYKKFFCLKKPITDEISDIKSKSQIDEVQLKIRNLENFISENTSSIPPLELKYYTDEIKSLNETLTQRRNGFQKVFSFKSKRMRLKPIHDNFQNTSTLSDSNGVHKAPDKLHNNISNINLLSEIENQNRLTYENITDKHLIIKNSTQHVFLQNVKNSIIQIQKANCSIHVENSVNLILLVDTNGPLMINHLSSFVLSGECHQLRLHDSHNGDISIKIMSKELILERCNTLRFFFDDLNVKINDFSSPNQQIKSPNYEVEPLQNFTKKNILESKKLDNFLDALVHEILQKLNL